MGTSKAPLHSRLSFTSVNSACKGLINIRWLVILQWALMNLALEATHYSEEGLPREKGQKFSTGTGVVSSENFRKAVIEEETIYLPASSCIPKLVTEQKIKHPALPNVNGK